MLRELAAAVPEVAARAAAAPGVALPAPDARSDGVLPTLLARCLLISCPLRSLYTFFA